MGTIGTKSPTRLTAFQLYCARNRIELPAALATTHYLLSPPTMETDTELIAASVLHNCLFAFLSYRSYLYVSCGVTCLNRAQRKWIKSGLSTRLARVGEIRMDKVSYGWPRFLTVFIVCLFGIAG